MTGILSDTVKLAAGMAAAAALAAMFLSSPDGLKRLASAASPGASATPSQQAPAGSVLALRPAAASTTGFNQSGEVHLTPNRNGNFPLSAEISGVVVPMIVDTGASMVVLSYEQAEEVGLHPTSADFRYVSQTANGRALFARVTLPYVRIGGIELDNVDAAVATPGAFGAQGLLGMTFLQRLRSYQVADGHLTLKN